MAWTGPKTSPKIRNRKVPATLRVNKPPIKPPVKKFPGPYHGHTNSNRSIVVKPSQQPTSQQLPPPPDPFGPKPVVEQRNRNRSIARLKPDEIKPVPQFDYLRGHNFTLPEEKISGKGPEVMYGDYRINNPNARYRDPNAPPVGYSPTFWEDPRHVAQAWMEYKALPPGELPPAWMDENTIEFLEDAYKYLSFANGDTPWTNWKYLHPDDPGRGFLQSMTPPPISEVMNRTDYGNILMSYMADDLTLRTPENMAYLTPQQQQMLVEYDKGVLQQEELDRDTPFWLKFVGGAMDNPITAGIAQIAPMAAVPLGLGLLSAPFTGGASLLPALGSAALMTASGAGVGYSQTVKYPWLSDAIAGASMGAPIGLGIGMPTGVGAPIGLLGGALIGGLGGMAYGAITGNRAADTLMKLFDLGAEYLVERPLGTAIQAAGAIISPESYGTWEEFLKSFGYAYKAGTMAYDTGAMYKELTYPVYQQLGVDTAENFGGMTREQPGFIWRAIATNPLNMLPYLNELAIKANLLRGPDNDINDIHYLDADATFQLGISPDPIHLTAVGTAAMVEFRRRLAKGEDFEKLYLEYQQEMGLAGMTSDLAGHMLLDPLNFWGTITKKTVSGVADIVGAKDLATTFRMKNVHGVFEGFREHEYLLRRGIYKTIDNMAGWEKNLIGWNEAARDFNVNLPTESQNAVMRMMDGAWRRRPDAAAIHYVEMASENFSALAEPYLRDNNINGLVALLEKFADPDMTPSRAVAELGIKALGSAEWYALKGLVADITPRLKMASNAYDGATVTRMLLYNLTDVLGKKSHVEILKDLSKIDTAEGVGRYFDAELKKVIDNPETDASKKRKAQDLLDKTNLPIEDRNRISLDELTRIKDSFLGKDHIASDVGELMAMMVDTFRTRAGEIAATQYKVKPGGKFFLFMNSLKRAQSIVLLGFNPSYVIANAVNNVISTLVAIPGWHTSGANRELFWREFGMTPYRLRQGIGLGGIAADSGVKGRNKGESVQYTEDLALGEKPIRSATNEPSSLVKSVDKALKKMGKYLPATMASQGLERLQSEIVTFKGVKTTMDALWRHGKNYTPMPSDLRTRLEAVDPSIPKWLDDIIRDNYSIDAMVKDMMSGEAKYNLTNAINVVANNMGIDTRLIDEVINHYDGFSDAIKNAAGEGGIREVFRVLREKIDDYLDDVTVNDAEERLREVATRVASGGEAEAFRIMDELGQTREFYQLMHEQMMVDAHAEADRIRLAGGTAADVTHHWINTEAKAARWWNRLSFFDHSSSQGIFRGLGIDNQGVRDYLGAITNTRTMWAEFYNKRRDLIREHYRTDFTSQGDREAHWKETLRQIDELYADTSTRVGDVLTHQDAAFVELIRGKYGDNVATAAMEWRRNLAEFNTRKAALNQAEREKMRAMREAGGSDTEQRREWQRYLREDLLPLHQEYNQLDTEGMQRMWRMATEQEAPPEPTVTPQTSTPKEEGAKSTEQPPLQPKTTDELKNDLRSLMPDIDNEQADYAIELVEGHARYLDMTPDEYIQYRLGGLASMKEPTTDGMYLAGTPNKKMREMVDWLAEAHYGDDYDHYYNSMIGEINRIYRDSRKRGEAVRENMKTLMSVDISGDCPFRQMGRACIYCYVETPRSNYEYTVNIKGEEWGSQSPNNIAHNKYNGEILNMHPELIKFLNNKMGGLTVFSIGDFQRADVKSLLAVIKDARAMGLNLKIITKQPETLELFGKVSGPEEIEVLVKKFAREDVTEDEIRELVTSDKDNLYFNLSTDYDAGSARVLADQALKRLSERLRRDLKTPFTYEAEHKKWAEVDYPEWKARRDKYTSDLAEWNKNGKKGERPHKPTDYPEEPKEPSPFLADIPVGEEFKRIYDEQYALWEKAYAEWRPRNEKYQEDLRAWKKLSKEKKAKVPKPTIEAAPKPPPEIDPTWWKPGNLDKVKYWTEERIKKAVDDLRVTLESGRDLLGYGFALDNAVELKNKYNSRYTDGKQHVTIRYVAMNNGDFVRAVLDPRTDLITMYHGYTDPEIMHRIWKIQNPYLTRDVPRRLLSPEEQKATGRQVEYLNPEQAASKELHDTLMTKDAEKNAALPEELRTPALVPAAATLHTRVPMSDDAVKALAAVFQASDVEAIRTKGQFSIVDQKFIDDAMGEPGHTKKEFLEKALIKSCCQTGKCGSCFACCGFINGIADDIVSRVMAGQPRAQTEFYADGLAVMRATSKANIADVAMQLGYIFRRDLTENDMRIAAAWAMGKDADYTKWTPEAEERFAKGFVKYLEEGKAPTTGMKIMFQRFRAFLINIYRRAIGTGDIGLDDNIRKVYDRMIGSEARDQAHATAQAIKAPAAQPGTEDFKMWFEGSKVVDYSGNPLRVYFGANSDITKFEWGGMLSTPFTTAKMASIFPPSGENLNIMPVYLSMKKPLIITDPEIMNEFLRSPQAAANMKTRLIIEGYDGIIDQVTALHRYYVLDPNQVRSTISDRILGQEALQRYQSAVDKVLKRKKLGTNSDIKDVPPPVPTNQKRTINLEEPPKRDYVYEMLKDIYKDEPTVANATMALLDAHAKEWADMHPESGYSAADWFELYIDEIIKGNVRPEDMTPELKIMLNQYDASGLAEAKDVFKGLTFHRRDSAKRAIYALEAKDQSTMIHEFTHVWFEDGSISIDDQNTLIKWFEKNGVKGFTFDKNGIPVSTDQVTWAAGHELFARGWEKYLTEGKAPIPELQPVFDRFRRWMINIYYSLTSTEQPDMPNLTPEVREVFARIIGAEQKNKSMGDMPPDLVQNMAPSLYTSQVETEGYHTYGRDIIDNLERALIENGPTGPSRIPENLQPEVMKYLKTIDGDMATAKAAAMGYGIKIRDNAMLDYTDQRGFDKYANLAFPYQYWYTRSMLNWAQRMYDRPAWFANYFRLREFMQSAQAESTFPSRLKNKAMWPAPYLPEWAGGQFYFDPLNNIFPFENFGTGLSRYQSDVTADDRAAIGILYDLEEAGEINRDDVKGAIQTRSGPVWEKALAQAKQGNKLDLFEMISLAQTPALWIGYLYNILKGTPEKITTLPMTRTGQALQGATEGATGPLAQLGNWVGKALAGPETAIRDKAGLSEFGEWGPYYIDRMLANMVADGSAPLKDAQIAMIEKTGPVYEEARRRVMLELAFKVPGAAPIYAASHMRSDNPWVNAEDIGSALIFGLYPASILPKGELIQRGLYEEYKLAGERYRAGDGQAYQDFYNDHPEYNARLALYKEPEGRMKSFLTSEIWDQWMELGSAERQMVKQDLGPEFQENFLDDPTNNYGLVDVETMAGWTKILGGYVPKTTDTESVINDPDIDATALKSAPPEELAEVNAYRQVRSTMFPNHYALGQRYFGLPEGSARQAFLARFPELKEYWDWNKAYKAAHPAIAKYSSNTSESGVQYDLSFVSEFSQPLLRSLYAYFYADRSLSDGSIAELNRIWELNGSQGEDFQNFIDVIVRSAIAPEQ